MLVTDVPIWDNSVTSRQSIAPKLVGSTVTVPFNFASDLAVGETLVVASCTCSVYSGTDASPSALLAGSASISGTVVSQNITAGVVGTLYELLCTATTSAGQTLLKSGYLAAVPDL